jgi:hypothetical protein
MQSRTLRAPAPGWAGWAVAVLLWVAADRATSQPRYRIATGGNRFVLVDRGSQEKRPFDMWITRLSNGLFDARYTDQIVANLDDYLRYGVNTLVVCLQGGGLGKDELYPRVFNADGSLILQSVVWSNLRRLLQETDRRGMVLMIQYWYFRRDENVPDDEKALEITRRATSWLKDTGYENYLFDVVNEFGHPDYGNRKVFSTPEGALRFLDAVYEVNPAVLACISPAGELAAPEGWLYDLPRGKRWVESGFIIGHNQVEDPLKSENYDPKVGSIPQNPQAKPYVNNEFYTQIEYERTARRNPLNGLYTWGHWNAQTVDRYLSQLRVLRGYQGYGNIHTRHQQHIALNADLPVALVGPSGTQPEASPGGGEPSVHWLYREVARMRKFGPLAARVDFEPHPTGVEYQLVGTWQVRSGVLEQTSTAEDLAWARLTADEGDVEIAIDATFLSDPGPTGRLGILLGAADPDGPAYRLLVGKDRLELDQVGGTLPRQTVLRTKLPIDQYRLRVADGRIAVAVGGKRVIDVADVDPKAGRNLLLVTQRAAASFDNVRITPLRRTDFEDGTPGEWTSEVAGAWKVVPASATNKHWEVVTPANERRRATLDLDLDDFALELLADLSATSGIDLEFRKADVAQAGGYGYLLAIGRDGSVTLDREEPSSAPVRLAAAQATITNPAAVRVRLCLEGNHVVLAVDGQAALDAVDPGSRLDRGGVALVARPGTTRVDELCLAVGAGRHPAPRFLPFSGPALPRGFTIEIGDPDGLFDLADFRLLINTGGKDFVDITFVLIPFFYVFGFKFPPDGKSIQFTLNSEVLLGPVNWTFRLRATDHDGNTTITDFKVP